MYVSITPKHQGYFANQTLVSTLSIPPPLPRHNVCTLIRTGELRAVFAYGRSCAIRSLMTVDLRIHLLHFVSERLAVVTTSPHHPHLHRLCPIRTKSRLRRTSVSTVSSTMWVLIQNLLQDKVIPSSWPGAVVEGDFDARWLGKT